MSKKFEIDPMKVIKNFSEIEHIVNAVSARMDEPRLEGKVIKPYVRTEGEMLKSLKKLTKRVRYDVPEETHPAIWGITYKFDSVTFIIYLKESKAITIIPTHLHEIGHIANKDLTYRSDKPPHLMAVLDEMLAQSFMHWAMEELNEITNLRYPHASAILLEELKFMLRPENINLGPIELASTDALVWQYAIHDFKRPKDVYKWCQETLSDEEKLNDFCRKIEEVHLKK